MARVRGRGPRRKTQWAGMGEGTGAAATLPVFVTLNVGVPQILAQRFIVNGGLGFLDEEVTITRMIGSFTAQLNLSAVNTAATLAIGCAVVRAEAATAGVASLPSPEDDPDFEWLYYSVMGLHHGPVANADAVVSGGIREFDVKGQRIVRAGNNVVWLGETETADMRVQVGGRYLVKLA